MDYIVYILGAGFSAPLGLPVMANFIERSKDLYFSDRQRFETFGRIYDMLTKFASVNLYYAADLHNIEEVLSILEMQAEIVDASEKKWFVEFIAQVTEALTPRFETRPRRRTAANWHHASFGPCNPLTYSHFVASIFNLVFSEDGGDGIVARRDGTDKCRYSIVSLNYDLVLEGLASQLNQVFDRHSDGELSDAGVYLAKLHGSVDSGNIVAPTWNKSLPGVVSEWKLALQLLMRANKVRILGYSLPIADSYVKYLLKSAIVGSVETQKTPHLKNVHVICRDRTGEVRRRYDELLKLPGYAFFAGDIETYLAGIFQERTDILAPQFSMQGLLEAAHSAFWKDIV